MSKLKCIPQQLCMNEAAPFCQHWSYASNHPMKEMLVEDYFLSTTDMLRPGDTIRVVQMKNSNVHAKDNEVLAFVDVTVVMVSRGEVVFETGKWVNIKQKKTEKIKEAA